MTAKSVRKIRIMTALILLFCITSGSLGALAQGYSPTPEDSPYFYYFGAKKIRLTLSPDQWLARFDEGSGNDLDSLGIPAAYSGAVSNPILEIDDFKVLRISEKIPEEALVKALSDFSHAPGVAFSGPVFIQAGNRLLITDEILVRFQDWADEDQIHRLLQSNQAEIVDRNAALGKYYHLKLRLHTSLETLSIVNTLSQNPLVYYATPNTIVVGQLATQSSIALPGDEHFRDQWYLNNANNVDINAPEAWFLTIGDPNIKIAIIDEGSDYEHPDLKNKVVYRYDYLENDIDPTPPLSFDPCGSKTNLPIEGHGTAVAGIAAAQSNNRIGIAGVCWECSLMLLRALGGKYIISSDGEGQCIWDGKVWEYVNFGETSAIVSAITTAWQQGADVINLSWKSSPSFAILDAINTAATQGRGGKGAIVVAAAGNDNLNAVAFPANMDNVIAVGASNRCDERKAAMNTPCNGGKAESGWGSNYGAELDVMAPGMQLGTTDVREAGGYSPADYFGSFSGTSGAAPIVSGVAGLVLSANPNLTRAEVQTILKDTAKVIGSPNETGSGRVDAYQAVKSASSVSAPGLHLLFPKNGWYNQREVHVEIYRAAGFGSMLGPVYSADANTNANAEVDFPLNNFAPGVYDIYFTPRANLRRGVLSQSITSGSNLTLDLQAWSIFCDQGQTGFCPGDVTGDNKINELDIGVIVKDYCTTPGEPACHYNSRSDLNYDGRVNALDYGRAIQKIPAEGDTRHQGLRQAAGQSIHAPSNDSYLEIWNFSADARQGSQARRAPAAAKVGDTFTLSLSYDPGGLSLESLDVVIDYDPCMIRPMADQMTRNIAAFPASNGYLSFGEFEYNTSIYLNGFDSQPAILAGYLFRLPFEVLTSDSQPTNVKLRFVPARTSDSNIGQYQTAEETLGTVYNTIVSTSGASQRPARTAQFVDLNNTLWNNHRIPLQVQTGDPCNAIFKTTFMAFIDGSWQVLGVDTDSSDGWRYDWDVSQLPDGVYQLKAFASDMADNGVETTASVTLDRSPATVNHIDLDPPYLTSNAPMNLRIFIDEAQNTSVHRVDIFARPRDAAASAPNDWVYLGAGTTALTPSTFTWQDPSGFAGPVALRVVVEDQAGNQSLYDQEILALSESRIYLPLVTLSGAEPNHPPYAADRPSPADAATNIPLSVILFWNSGGDPDGDDARISDVYFEAGDSTPDVLVSHNEWGLSYTPAALAYSTTYYWQIVVTDEHGASTPGPIWSFTTVDPPPAR